VVDPPPRRSQRYSATSPPFLPASTVRFLPFFTGNGLLAIDSDTATADSIAVALTRPENGLLFGGYTFAALIVGTVLLYRRDTN
jgi:ABC-2 type transport system permease protein